MSLLNRLRQKDLLPEEKLATRILFIGAGGIGSFTVEALCKMGFYNVQVWDKDEIESHNIPNQNFGPEQETQLKVAALKANVLRETGVMIDAVNGWWEGDLSYNPDLIITGVDSQDARIRIYDKLRDVIRSNGRNITLLDARMSAGSMSLYVVNSNDKESIKAYEDLALFPQAEGEQEPCTARSIIYNGFCIAGYIGSVVRNIVTGREVRCSYIADFHEFRIATSSQIINKVQK